MTFITSRGDLVITPKEFQHVFDVLVSIQDLLLYLQIFFLIFNISILVIQITELSNSTIVRLKHKGISNCRKVEGLTGNVTSVLQVGCLRSLQSQIRSRAVRYNEQYSGIVWFEVKLAYSLFCFVITFTAVSSRTQLVNIIDVCSLCKFETVL